MEENDGLHGAAPFAEILERSRPDPPPPITQSQVLESDDDDPSWLLSVTCPDKKARRTTRMYKRLWVSDDSLLKHNTQCDSRKPTAEDTDEISQQDTFSHGLTRHNRKTLGSSTLMLEGGMHSPQTTSSSSLGTFIEPMQEARCIVVGRKA